MKTQFKLLLILNLIFLSGSLFAQGGSAGAQELLIPVGAQNLALNSSYVSGTSGIEAIYFNPAGLANNTGAIDAMFTYMRFIADVNVSYAAAASSLGDFGTIALSMKSLDFGDIPVTTTQQPYGTGEMFSPTFIVAGLSYGRNLSSDVNIGFTTNIIFEKIIETSASGVSFDFGFQYANIGFNGLKFGAVLKNLGPNMSFDGTDLLRAAEDTLTGETKILKIDPSEFELPLVVDFGFSYLSRFLDSYSIMISASIINSSYILNQFRFGGEFNYDNLIFLRGGYHINLDEINEDRNIYGPALGMGIKLKSFFNISVDYAYRVTRLFDSNQMLSVVIGF